MDTLQDDYDSPWKEILECYFQEFIAFFFPVIAKEIDWLRGYAFLDKELQRVARDADLGRRYADNRKEDVVRLFHFIDWVMNLPDYLEDAFWREIRQYEETRNMTYMSSVERIGYKRGGFGKDCQKESGKASGKACWKRSRWACPSNSVKRGAGCSRPSGKLRMSSA